MAAAGVEAAYSVADLAGSVEGALEWPAEWIKAHQHHHHRFGTEPVGPGAEVEASRGCPYDCSFCAK